MRVVTEMVAPIPLLRRGIGAGKRHLQQGNRRRQDIVCHLKHGGKRRFAATTVFGDIVAQAEQDIVHAQIPQLRRNVLPYAYQRMQKVAAEAPRRDWLAAHRIDIVPEIDHHGGDRLITVANEIRQKIRPNPASGKRLAQMDGKGGRFAARLLARKLHHPADVPSKTSFSISGIVRRGSTRLFKRRDDCVSAALERIWRPGGAKLTPREILAAFPCSRRSAEIRFRQATGHAVLEELQKARIHQAKQLLANTNLPVSAIAENCGYASLAHFRDTFRKEAGANPFTWRKSHRCEVHSERRMPT